MNEHNITDSAYCDRMYETSCTLSGGFIIFGGWLNIFPGNILGDGVSRKAYCAMGGLGITAYNDTGVFTCANGGCPDGKWWTPQYVYNNTASVMAYAASSANPEGAIILFDKHSNIIATVKPDSVRSPFVGGGTVKWTKA